MKEGVMTNPLSLLRAVVPQHPGSFVFPFLFIAALIAIAPAYSLAEDSSDTDLRKARITADVGSKGLTKGVLKSACASGLSMHDIVEALVKAGKSPQDIVYFSKEVCPSDIVKACFKAGGELVPVAAAARSAGYTDNAIMDAAKESGFSDAAISSALSGGGLGYSAPGGTTSGQSMTTFSQGSTVVIGGGGGGGGSRPASPYKPK